MRAILILAAVVLLAIVAGWLRFSRDGNRATIQVDGGEVQDDTERLVQEGREMISRTRDAVDNGVNNADRAADEMIVDGSEAEVTETRVAPASRD